MNISGALGGIMGRSPEGRPDRNRSPRLGSPRGTSTSRDSTLDPNQAATVGHISEIMNEIRGLKGILEPISQNVKKVETDLTKVKPDLHHHVEAVKVDSSNIHEQLGKLDTQIQGDQAGAGCQRDAADAGRWDRGDPHHLVASSERRGRRQ